MADAADVLDVAEAAVAVAIALGGRVDRLDLAAGGEPHGAVQLVAVVDADPGAAEGVGVRGDVVTVLVPALARLARRLEEEHRLHRQHVRAHEHLQHVQHARVQHVPLVQRQLAVEHVDAQEVLRLLHGRKMLGRRLQPLAGDAGVPCEVAVRHLLLLLGEPALHQVLGVLPQLLDLLWRDQIPHHEKPLAAEGDVLFDRDAIANSLVLDSEFWILDCWGGGGHGGLVSFG